MRLLPLEKKERLEAAKKQFAETGKINFYEPCNCGSHVRHNNGGNYHEIIFLRKENNKFYVKNETTCELTPPAEWEEQSEAEIASLFEYVADWL